jgi:hypothetical protein
VQGAGDAVIEGRSTLAQVGGSDADEFVEVGAGSAEDKTA